MVIKLIIYKWYLNKLIKYYTVPKLTSIRYLFIIHILTFKNYYINAHILINCIYFFIAFFI